jgi:excisionase family DNA binding protein
MSNLDPIEELRRLYPPILTTAHVAEMMHCTIGDVRDKVHSKELKAMRWGQQFRFFREEVIAAMRRVDDEDGIDLEDEDAPDETTQDES